MIPPEFPPQRNPVNPQNLCGFGFVLTDLIENPDDIFRFVFLERQEFPAPLASDPKGQVAEYLRADETERLRCVPRTEGKTMEEPDVRFSVLQGGAKRNHPNPPERRAGRLFYRLRLRFLLTISVRHLQTHYL